MQPAAVGLLRVRGIDLCRAPVGEHQRRAEQTLGFSLEQITDLLTLMNGKHCREAEQLGSARLATVRERMAQLPRVEKVLA
jgi:MerR family mercuric resistance operon transcriptional regulator